MTAFLDRVGRIGLALVMAAMLGLSARPALAQSKFPQAFVVADVPGDATAQDAVAAREAARAQGLQAAFQQLLQRLTQPSDWPRLPHLDATQITDLLVDFQVANEHSSAVRYFANFTFRFNPRAVRDLLNRAGIPFTELASKPVVIVPVLTAGGETRLWDDPNPWRDAWNSVPGRSGVVPWVVPVGDLADVSALDQPDASAPKPEQIQALSQHYDGGDVVTAVATESPGGQGVKLDIAVTRYGADGPGATVTASVDGPKADASLFLAGVQAASQLLESQWKEKTAPAVVSTDERTIEVTVPIGSPADWSRIRSKLSAVPVVHHMDVELIARGEVRLLLRVAADPTTLRVALAQQDLAMADGSPFATLTSSPQAPPAIPSPEPPPT
ncbi:MAG TPA: DUF2066 domain-containing protein [Stellaceae bacterium]|nr:DUF2066 domain-containing protein [Stellaceae bacterium]